MALFANCATAQNNSLAGYQSEYRQLSIASQNCFAQDDEWRRQNEIYAPQGIFIPLPTCHNYDQQRQARLAQLEAVIDQMSGVSTATPLRTELVSRLRAFSATVDRTVVTSSNGWDIAGDIDPLTANARTHRGSRYLK
jgi:hypothetical protein